MKFVVIYATFPDSKTAQKIIRDLIRRKLAACGNIFKISSIYTWKGKVKRAGECGALIKIKASHYKKVEQYIKERHPYEVPEIISWPVTKGLKEYLDWINAST